MPYDGTGFVLPDVEVRTDAALCQLEMARGYLEKHRDGVPLIPFTRRVRWVKSMLSDGNGAYCLRGVLLMANGMPMDPCLASEPAESALLRAMAPVERDRAREMFPGGHMHIGKYLAGFNNHPKTKVADVLALIDRAIDLRRRELTAA